MTKGHLRALLIVCAGLVASLAHAQTAQTGNRAFFDRICKDSGQSAHHAQFVEWLQTRLQLNETQKEAFKSFQDARAASIAASQGKLCANDPHLSSFEGQVLFNQTLLESRVEAMKAENPKLITFYNTLSESQKTIFEETRRSLHD